jgi:hypothetical protein
MAGAGKKNSLPVAIATTLLFGQRQQLRPRQENRAHAWTPGQTVESHEKRELM